MFGHPESQTNLLLTPALHIRKLTEAENVRLIFLTMSGYKGKMLQSWNTGIMNILSPTKQ